PVLHLYDIPLGKATLSGTTVRFASLSFEYDAAAERLSGTVPADLAPLYALTTTLTRKAVINRTPRSELDAPVRSPVWITELDTPVWSDVAAADGVVYAGGDDGRLHALAAKDGATRWVYATEGPLRARPTIAAGRIYVISDDGVLHRVGAGDGRATWQ